jgi:hypothetical protein
MEKFSVQGMFITTTGAARPSARWSKARASLVVQRRGLPSRLGLKWHATLHSKSNRISWNAKDGKYPYRSCKIYPKK